MEKVFSINAMKFDLDGNGKLDKAEKAAMNKYIETKLDESLSGQVQNPITGNNGLDMVSLDNKGNQQPDADNGNQQQNADNSTNQQPAAGSNIENILKDLITALENFVKILIALIYGRNDGQVSAPAQPQEPAQAQAPTQTPTPAPVQPQVPAQAQAPAQTPTLAPAQPVVPVSRTPQATPTMVLNEPTQTIYTPQIQGRSPFGPLPVSPVSRTPQATPTMVLEQPEAPKAPAQGNKPAPQSVATPTPTPAPAQPQVPAQAQAPAQTPTPAPAKPQVPAQTQAPAQTPTPAPAKPQVPAQAQAPVQPPTPAPAEPQAPAQAQAPVQPPTPAPAKPQAPAQPKAKVNPNIPKSYHSINSKNNENGTKTETYLNDKDQGLYRVIYDKEGNILSETTFEYDDKGDWKCAKTIEYYTDGTIEYTVSPGKDTSLVKDINGNPIQKTIKERQNSGNKEIVVTYNKDGSFKEEHKSGSKELTLDEVRYFDKDKKCYKKRLYNSDGKTIKKTLSYNPDGSVKSWSVYEKVEGTDLKVRKDYEYNLNGEVVPFGEGKSSNLSKAEQHRLALIRYRKAMLTDIKNGYDSDTLKLIQKLSDEDFKAMFCDKDPAFAKELTDVLYDMANSDDIIRYILSRQSSLLGANNALYIYKDSFCGIPTDTKIGFMNDSDFSSDSNKSKYRRIDINLPIDSDYNVDEDDFLNAYLRMAKSIK